METPAVTDGLAAAQAAPNRTARLYKDYVYSVSVTESTPHWPCPRRLIVTINNLQTFSGQKLRDRVGEALYYKALTATDYAKRHKGLLTDAVQQDNMLRERGKLMKATAFQRLAKLPDDELRQLASQNNGELLWKRFIQELARDKDAELQHNKLAQQVNAIHQNQAQAQAQELNQQQPNQHQPGPVAN